ncbi:MAG TPA: hypothetical protein VGW80_11555 [Solirubrobacterales bacterium]|jgi:hypothetical protein|nr:hypothetical protein [Solirubrobacterales bacterium]
MPVETVYHCDWRDCDSHVQTASPGPPSVFITVTEDAGRCTHHFCSWDCVLMFAGEKPPAITIPVGGEDFA